MGSRAGAVDSCPAGVGSCIGGVGSRDGEGESESRRDGVDSHIEDAGGVGSRMTDGMDPCAYCASSGGSILTSRGVPSCKRLKSDCDTSSITKPVALSCSDTGDTGGGGCE